MSSSSDSEDENLKLILEAVDTSLLTDSLFNNEKKQALEESTVLEISKSERHLQDDDGTGIDFVPPDAVQKIMSKKLATLVEERIEFVTDACSIESSKKHKQKSRVKLLNDFECYVKPYEEFEYEDIGVRKRPTIKRRDVDDCDLNEESKLKSVAMDGNYVLLRTETKNWTERSKGKVFCYKKGGSINKVHHFVENENEFTKLRRKNKWNEAKIKSTKFSVK